MGWSLAGVDGDQPRDEHCAQLVQLVGPEVGLGLKHFVDLGFDHPAHAAHRFVFREANHVTALDAVVQLLEGEGQQRQGVAAAGIGHQSSDQVGFETQPGHLGRLFDDRAQGVGVQETDLMYQ
jgi:hypothetical protein